MPAVRTAANTPRRTVFAKIPVRVTPAVAALSLLVALALPAARSARAQSAPPADTILQATSSAEHLWLIIPDPKGTADLPFQLRYHNTAMDGPLTTLIRRLSRRPDAILAVGDRLFVIWQRNDPNAGYEVASLRAMHNPSYDAYYAMPVDRMETNESLPAGRLASLGDHVHGPVALLMPRNDINDSVSQPTLLQLRSSGWVQWPLPEGFDPARRTLLSSDQQSGRRLLLLQGGHDDPQVTNVYAADDEKQWSRSQIALDLNSIRAVRRAMGRAVIVQYNSEQGQTRLGFLRPDEVLWFASFKPKSESWQIIGLRNGLQLLRKSMDGSSTLTLIDPITGELDEAQPLRPHSTKAGRIWFVALVMAGALGVTLLVVLIRPPKEATPPKEMAPVPAMQRLAALMIDVFPAAVITLLVTRCSIAELLQAPLITPKLIMSWQYIMLVGLTLAHTTISEALRGTTIGKAILGAHIVTYDGGKPTLRQILIRALGKFMTFMVLPTAAIALFSRIAQGLDDLLARTIVVHERQPEQDDKQMPS